jgi:hypothetical protein
MDCIEEEVEKREVLVADQLDELKEGEKEEKLMKVQFAVSVLHRRGKDQK